MNNYTTTRRTENAFEKRRLPASDCLFYLQSGVGLSRTALRTTPIQHQSHITPSLIVRSVVDATRLGAWLRSGEGIGWLAAGIIPNTLYRVPFFYFFSGRCILLLLLSFCRFCFVSLCFLLLSLERCRCFSDIFLSSRPRTGLATIYITGYGRGPIG